MALASSTLQAFDGARERRAIRVREIELIPARNVSADPLDTQNEPESQTKAFQESCGTDHILSDDPRCPAPLHAELLQPAETSTVGHIDFAPHETVEANVGGHRLPGNHRSHDRRRCSIA